jgi:hypothetical protein
MMEMTKLFRSAIAGLIVLVFAATVGCSIVSVGQAAEGDIVRVAGSFDRACFKKPEDAELIRKAGNLGGSTKPGQRLCSKGWVEYDINVAHAGWYELIVPIDRFSIELAQSRKFDYGVFEIDYVVDGDVYITARGDKASNLWLEAGKHTIRIARYHWSGFPSIEKLILRPSGPTLAKRLRLSVVENRTVVGAGDSLQLMLQAGGRMRSTKATVHLQDAKTQEIVSSADVAIPAGKKPADLAVSLPCPREGLFDVHFTEGDRPIDVLDVPSPTVVVVDTRRVKRGGELKKTLLSEIDCVATEPQFTGVGGSNVVRSVAGAYRESGDAGFLFAQHKKRDSSWFAYCLNIPKTQKPYVIETDYPDDAFRTFCISIREALPPDSTYPVTSGVDTGECYTLTRKMQTDTMLFWPRTTDVRVVLMAVHNGRRAAASKIRLYRVDGDLPLLDVPVRGGRSFANWYEEGANFTGLYGAPDIFTCGRMVAADRWARSVASIGGDTIIPSVAVYNMSLYPSLHNAEGSNPNSFDFTRLLLLKCEKYGIGLIGEINPQCSDLDRIADPTGKIEPRPNILMSKDGFRAAKRRVPVFNPLHPVNQKWYLDMIGEFVDRYKDSQALRGVSLRLINWQNTGLNNFLSLDWGYDDLTVGLFEKETGISTGVKTDDNPQRFHARYDWLMAHARDPWIEWRCRKIAGIYTKARDRVRRARPDLVVYSGDYFGYFPGDDEKGAGIDPKLLGAIDGVVLINAHYAYGRQKYTYKGPLGDAKKRDRLLDPAELVALRSPANRTAFLYGADYVEGVPDAVVTPESLGFPKNIIRRWTSGVLNPAGRHYLERYAATLAEADALFLGDGGNAYTLGQPLLLEFLREYRQLPPMPFHPRADARDPVAVWELSDPKQKRFVFYAVNRERFPVSLDFHLAHASEVRRLSSDKPSAIEGSVLRLSLKPYELAAFTANGDAAIQRVKEQIPAADLDRVTKQVEWISRLAKKAKADRVSGKLSPEQVTRIVDAAAQAKKALDGKAVWRARTILERSELIAVYRTIEQFPPKLYDMGS